MPIDVHAHYVPNSILATLEERAQDFGLSLVKTPPSCALHFDYGLKIRPFFSKLIEPVEQRLDGMATQGRHLPDPVGVAGHFRLRPAEPDCVALASADERMPGAVLPEKSAAVRVVRFGAVAGCGGGRARSGVCDEAAWRRRPDHRLQRRGRESRRNRSRRILGRLRCARCADLHPSGAGHAGAADGEIRAVADCAIHLRHHALRRLADFLRRARPLSRGCA